LSAERPRNLFAARSDQNALSTQDKSQYTIEARRSGDYRPVPSGKATSVKTGVRERFATQARQRTYTDRPKGPAHPSNRLVAQLGTNWRVVNDPLQWMLQRRKGNPRKKNSGWQNRSFCRMREGLLRCVRENCGEIDQDALTRLQALPEHHPNSRSSIFEDVAPSLG
jgi:hypothetical protein